MWLPDADRIPSPNFDERPADQTVDLLVIHNISLPPDQFGGNYVEQFFRNCLDPAEHEYFADIVHLRVSSHLYIRRDGRLVQFVSLGKRAWHAGQSCWRGRQRCNDFSIGIELEGSDSLPFEDRQYFALAQATKEIQLHYPQILNENITGHSDIAPGRKTDPGPCFDWERYKSLI